MGTSGMSRSVISVHDEFQTSGLHQDAVQRFLYIKRHEEELQNGVISRVLKRHIPAFEGVDLFSVSDMHERNWENFVMVWFPRDCLIPSIYVCIGKTSHYSQEDIVRLPRVPENWYKFGKHHLNQWRRDEKHFYHVIEIKISPDNFGVEEWEMLEKLVNVNGEWCDAFSKNHLFQAFTKLYNHHLWRQAWLQSQHKRLGQDSLAFCLPIHISHMILEMAENDEEDV